MGASLPTRKPIKEAEAETITISNPDLVGLILASLPFTNPMVKRNINEVRTAAITAVDTGKSKKLERETKPPNMYETPMKLASLKGSLNLCL